MSVLHRNRNTSEEAIAAPPAAASTDALEEPLASRKVYARVGSTWLGLYAAAVISAGLVIFMVQNTNDVEVSFLWLNGTLPLAMALLVTGIATAFLTVFISAVRIKRLRHMFDSRH